MQSERPHRVSSRNTPGGVALNLLASALTILTAIALLGTAAVVGDSSTMVVGLNHSDRVIRDFYRAVNMTFRSGDSTALDRIVAPNLVFSSSTPGITPNRAGLERLLISVHDTSPSFQLQVEDMVIDGDRAVVRVTGGSERPGSFLGLSLASAPSMWGQFDSFRIADHQIVELWSGAPASVLFEPATEVPLDLETNPHAVLFERFSANTGERREWGTFLGSRVLYVDEGTITVDLGPTDLSPVLSTPRMGQVSSTQVAPGGHVVVTADEAMAFPAESQYRFQHDAMDARVVAFTVAFPRFHYTGPHQPHASAATDEDVPDQADLGAVQMAVGGAQVFDPAAGVTVALGRAHLPSGATTAFHKVDGSLFMVVEAGSLVLTREHDVMSLDRLVMDDLGQVKPGESFALHNDGNNAVTVFMVTVLRRTKFATPAS